MNLYRMQVTGPAPAQYRGIVGTNDAQAIAKAQARHQAAGNVLSGHQFQIVQRLLIVCVTAIEEEA